MTQFNKTNEKKKEFYLNLILSVFYLNLILSVFNPN
jgi:hypothetical protein